MSVEILPIVGIPEIETGADIGALIAGAAGRQGVEVGPEDALVVSQKAVSKAEGRVRSLDAVEPGAQAAELGAKLDKDPRLVQLVLDESREVLRAERGVLITETREGWVCANAGIDASNVPGTDTVALLPADSDASARRIRGEFRAETGVSPAVVVGDSFGRAWRVGQADVAIGCAGLRPVDDWRGRTDGQGRELTATIVAIADEVASAADLVRSKVSATPVALVRGLGDHVTADDGPGAASLRRAEAEDLFR